MLTSHILQRLQQRHIAINPAILNQLAQACKVDSAVLLAKLPSHIGCNNSDYYQRKESNGNLVYLIIRDNHIITIMYRRDNQNNTTDGLRVDAIIDLSSDLQKFVKVTQ